MARKFKNITDFTKEQIEQFVKGYNDNLTYLELAGLLGEDKSQARALARELRKEKKLSKRLNDKYLLLKDIPDAK